MLLTEFNELLRDSFRLEVSSETTMTVKYSMSGNGELKLKKKQFKDAVKNLNAYQIEEGSELFTDTHYEVAIGMDRMRMIFRDTDTVIHEDKWT